MASIETFGVDARQIHDRHFPQLAHFSANSNPSESTIREMVDDAAAELAGALSIEDLSPETFAQDPSSSEYVWCAATVRLSAAIEVAGALSQTDPEIVKAWRGKLERRYESLAQYGVAALGGTDSETITASNGPKTHIREFGLELSSRADVSSALPVFRKGDVL